MEGRGKWYNYIVKVELYCNLKDEIIYKEKQMSSTVRMLLSEKQDNKKCLGLGPCALGLKRGRPQ